MLDVHPPHHPVHAWRDFFIHIATITVGLLIAVSLEQTVEALHHRQQRQELREALGHETEQIEHDGAQVEQAVSAEIGWLQQVDQILAAAKNHQAIGPLPPEPAKDFDIPDDPVYKAAKDSTKFVLLTQQETEAFGEMDGLIGHGLLAYSHRADAIRAVLETQRGLRLSQTIPPSAAQGSFSLSTRGFSILPGLKLSTEDLQQMYRNTVALEVSSEEFLYWTRQMRGAAVVMRDGERNLHRIQAAERRFNTLP